MANTRKSKSDLTQRVAGVLAPVTPAGSRILVGLSGGVDSVVLLHLLHRLAPQHSWQLSALHVHHGISPRADEWAAFCELLCESLRVSLQVERVNIQPLRDMGIEAAARKLRHEALARQGADFIALAHHQDDQAETMLLQLLRGAGVKGAAAMPHFGLASCSARTGWIDVGAASWPRHTQSRPGGRSHTDSASSSVLLRPLLDISRAELLAYADEHQLQWVEDESNDDDSYPRNFLRHRVLPLLEQRFPACNATLARSAQHFAEAAHLLDELAQQDAQGAYEGDALAIERLSALDAVRAKNLLRWFIHQHGALMPEASRLEEMLRQVCTARDDAQVCVAWDEWEMHCYRGGVYICRALPEVDADWSMAWNGEAELHLPQLGGVLRCERRTGEGLSLAKLSAAPLILRLRHGEAQLRPDSKRPARTLKYLFQEYGVPPWRRKHWPLLYCGEMLAAVPGIAVDCAYQAAVGEAGVVLTWDAT